MTVKSENEVAALVDASEKPLSEDQSADNNVEKKNGGSDCAVSEPALIEGNKEDTGEIPPKEMRAIVLNGT